MAMAAQNWLHSSGFYRETGILPDHFHHVYQRWEKRRVCDRLGITHFVDDRWDVLQRLSSSTRKYLFSVSGTSAPNGACGVPRTLPPSVVICSGWRDVLADLRVRLDDGAPLARPQPTFAIMPPERPRPSSAPLACVEGAAAIVDDADTTSLPTQRFGSGTADTMRAQSNQTRRRFLDQRDAAEAARPTHRRREAQHEPLGVAKLLPSAPKAPSRPSGSPSAPKAPGMYRPSGSPSTSGSPAAPDAACTDAVWPQWRIDAARALRDSRCMGPCQEARLNGGIAGPQAPRPRRASLN